MNLEAQIRSPLDQGNLREVADIPSSLGEGP
jgi:hypothetical protein